MKTRRSKTLSKHFFDDEIKGVYIDSQDRKCIYLKDHVYRTNHPNPLSYDYPEHRNRILDMLDNFDKANALLFGGKDDSQDNYN